MYRKKFDEAINYFKQSLELRPSFPEALCSMGIALYNLN